MEIFRINALGKMVFDVPEKHLFLGTCHGIALVPRGKNDNHICFYILTEDDGVWFVSNNMGSTYWLHDLKKQLQQVEKWLSENAIKVDYGYMFKI